MIKTKPKSDFLSGFMSGVPIGLGYLSVSFTFGIMSVKAGLPIWAAVLISMTNLTSAGQFAAVPLIAVSGSLFELALTQLVINIRYSLMSLSLSQKFDSSVTVLDRFIIAFGNTDEIFGVASSQKNDVSKKFMYGLMIMPFLCWTGGTFLGAVASEILPFYLQTALGIAIYGMFIAIIIPAAKVVKPVLYVIVIATVISCAFKWIPFLSTISSGFVIIVSGVISSAIIAKLFPVKEESTQ